MDPADHSSKIMDTLVVLPAFNEEASIALLVKRILQERIGDILVINDGSEDQTLKHSTEAGAMVLNLPFNLGIGGAVQTGLKLAQEMGYGFVVRLDGDGQHNVKEAGQLLQIVRDNVADVAVGSRFLPGNVTYKPPFSRWLGIRWFAFLITLFTGQKVTDPTSGMFAANRKAIKVLAKEYPQDYPEVEARLWMHKNRLRVIEAPVHMLPRKAGKSSISFFRAIYYMFKVTLATIVTSLRRSPM